VDCQLIEIELAAYHFGSVPEPTRDSVEAHLCECPRCLKSYLALKRELETAQAGPRPSEAARQKLRRAVARELEGHPSLAAEPRWWRGPLVFGFVTAATAAAMLAVVSLRGELLQLSRLAAPDHGIVQPGAGSLEAK
jgi:anti-sigma factor RsiW